MDDSEQRRLLEEATAVVKEQSFYMKQSIDREQLREALKHASNLICELRTSLLSPKNYYDLYMHVFQELQHLDSFFMSLIGKKKMADLYESVQHAANILPRLYLLVTVGAAFIGSKEAPATEVLKDVSELCKGTCFCVSVHHVSVHHGYCAEEAGDDCFSRREVRWARQGRNCGNFGRVCQSPRGLMDKALDF